MKYGLNQGAGIPTERETALLIEQDAPDALAYLERVNAMDVAPILGLVKTS